MIRPKRKERRQILRAFCPNPLSAESAKYGSPGQVPRQRDAALGVEIKSNGQALKGRNCRQFALSALKIGYDLATQGVALGYHILPFQGIKRTGSAIIIFGQQALNIKK